MLSGDVPLVSAELIAGVVATHERDGAAATVVTAVLDEPGHTAGSSASADGRRSRRSSRPRPTATRPPSSSRSRRSTPASTSSTARRWPPLLPQLSNDNAQGEYYLPDVAAAAPRGAAVGSRPRLRGPERDPRRQLPRRPRAGRGRGAAADPRAPHARRRHDRRSRLDLDRGRRRDRARRAHRARLLADRRHRDRDRIGDRPAHDPHRLPDRRRASRPALLPARMRGRRPLPRSARSPTCGRAHGSPRARRPAPSSRSRTRGSAPARRCRTSPTSATPTSARAPTSAPATITANYDGFVKSRTKIGTGARTGVDTTLVAPVEVGDSAYTGAGSVITRTFPRGARDQPVEQANVEGYAERKAEETEAEVSEPAR